MNDSTPNTSSNNDSGILANQLSASWLAWARNAVALAAGNRRRIDRRRDPRRGCLHPLATLRVDLRSWADVDSQFGQARAEPLEVAPTPSGEVQLGGDAGALDGRQRDAIRLDMIRMVVPTELVVGDHDLRLIALHQDRKARRALLDRHVPERPRTILVLPLDHARVLIAELLEDMNTEDVARLVQLGQTDRRDGRFIVGRVAVEKGVAFEELARRNGDYALCGVGAVVRVEDDEVVAARAGYLSVSDVPTVVDVTPALAGGVDDGSLAAAGALAPAASTR